MNLESRYSRRQLLLLGTAALGFGLTGCQSPETYFNSGFPFSRKLILDYGFRDPSKGSIDYILTPKLFSPLDLEKAPEDTETLPKGALTSDIETTLLCYFSKTAESSILVVGYLHHRSGKDLTWKIALSLNDPSRLANLRLSWNKWKYTDTYWDDQDISRFVEGFQILPQVEMEI